MERTVVEIEKLGPIHRPSRMTFGPRSLRLLYGPPGSGKTYTARLLYGIPLAPKAAAHSGDSCSTQWSWDKLVEAVFTEVYGADAPSLLRSARFTVSSGDVSLTLRDGRANARYNEATLREEYARHRPVVEEARATASELLEHSGQNSGVAELMEESKWLFLLSFLSRLYSSIIDYDFTGVQLCRAKEATETGILAAFEPANVVYAGHGRAFLLMMHNVLSAAPIKLGADARRILGYPPFRALYMPLLEIIEELLLSTRESLLASKLYKLDPVLEKLASTLLLQGDIGSAPERRGLVYKRQGVSVYLYSSPGAVTEVAVPLIALYRLARGGRLRGVLFVEEPEAQLHPQLQRAMAWLLLYLSGRGLTVISTTHSDFLAVEIKIAVRAARLGAKAVQRVLAETLGTRLGLDEADVLAKAVRAADTRLVVFDGEGFREEPVSVLEKGVPEITSVVEDQVHALEIIGELEDEQH
ncbi:AAA family ATPase [Pyrodictium abyssi]|uniref:AAA family ATPase n=1 Tax=Pyrodictium abyssi TaxID=54256 RepID=UPI0030C77D1A